MAAAGRWFSGLPGAVRGAIWMSLACLMFACMSMVARGLSTGASDDLHGLEIAFFRSLFGFFVILPYGIRAGRELWRTSNHRLYVARGASGAGFTIFYFPALALIPIADAQALSFTTPLFGVLLATIFLRETLHRHRLVAVLIGFTGALIVIRPGFEQVGGGMIFVLLSSLSAGISSNLTKFATRTDPPDKVVFFHALYMTPMTLGPALFVWQWPTLEQLLWLALIGFLATLNQRCLSRALAAADATAVLPFLFMRLPFAAILGYAAFVEFPGLFVWIGGAVIFGAALYLARGEARLGRRVSL